MDSLVVREAMEPANKEWPNSGYLRGLTVKAVMQITQYISSASTEEMALNNLVQIENAKHALQVADQFKEVSVKFAMLEASALIRVVELGGAKHIKPQSRRKAAEWLYGLTSEERKAEINKCANGVTIERVWRDEVEKPRIRANAKITAKVYADTVLATYESMGVVSLSTFESKLDELPIDETMANGTKDEVRNKLRKLGAVGIGDGKGTYVNRDNKEQIAQAVDVRISSIENDILSLAKIISDSGCEKPLVRIDQKSNMNQELPMHDVVAVMLACAGVIQVEARSTRKEGNILNWVISNTFPDFYRSTELLEVVAKEASWHDDRLSDKTGYVSMFFRQAKESAQKVGA